MSSNIKLLDSISYTLLLLIVKGLTKETRSYHDLKIYMIYIKIKRIKSVVGILRRIIGDIMSTLLSPRLSAYWTGPSLSIVHHLPELGSIRPKSPFVLV